MATDHAFFDETVSHGARRLRIAHALHELRREKIMRGVLYPAHVAAGDLKPEVAEDRNTSLDDAIAILDALHRRPDVLMGTAAHLRLVRDAAPDPGAEPASRATSVATGEVVVDDFYILGPV